MPAASRRSLAFVRALLAGGQAAPRADGIFAVAGVPRTCLAPDAVGELVSAGVLRRSGSGCVATAEARHWVRRQLLEGDGFAGQHRVPARRPDGATVNLAESPLARLASAAGTEPAFLAPHQVEAGERVRRLVERARLQPRVTMRYDAAHTAGGSAGGPADLSDMAADARRQLAEIARVLPRDCTGVVLDVCGLLKGLQTIETERGWPRRSAKLVLRIGLDQLARHFGLAPEATGAENGRQRAWLDAGARPDVFA